MRRIAILLGAGLLLALQTGCPPTYPKCNNDENCKEQREVCVQGQCVECATDGQCKANFTCQANKCVPRPPECRPGDNKCGPGKRCDEAGKCVTAECDPSKPCRPGSTCQDGRCVARAPGTCDTTAECGVNEKCEANKCVTAGPPQGTCNWDPILFGFNESSLTSEARERLSGVADCVKQERGKVRLEGHADERGTEEYNLLLSNRRAAAAKKYLTDLGVPDNKLDTVGYGENRPASPGHDEDAWSRNRRVELKR
jgi:peptidoglycan-associated lipoprotein